jgi:hypothetical protein
VFKEATDAFGDVAIVGGAIMASQHGRHSDVDEVGLGLVVAGVLSKIFSAATIPAADTRTWDNLPQYLGFASFQSAPGARELEFEFLGNDGQPIAGRTQTLTVQVESGKDTVVFVSDNNP